MKLGKKLAVGEVVECTSIEEPPAHRSNPDAVVPVQLVEEPAERPVVAHAEG
jgi:hypothetical protein